MLDIGAIISDGGELGEELVLRYHVVHIILLLIEAVY